MDIAFTRLDHQNQSNVGLLGSMTFLIIEDNLVTNDSLTLAINIAGSTALLNDGNFLPMAGVQNGFYFGGGNSPSGIVEVVTTGKLTLSPNPTFDVCRLHYELPETAKVSFRLCTVEGIEIWADSGFGKSFSREIDLSALPAGLYILTARTDAGYLTEKIVKL